MQPKLAVRFLLFIAVGLAFVHITGEVLQLYPGNYSWLFSLDINRDQTVQRVYSSILLFLNSGLLINISVVLKMDNHKDYYNWTGLGLFFLVLAITKLTSLHEYLWILIRSALQIPKILFFLCAYVIAVIFLFSYYRKFLLGQKKRVRILFIAAGLTFMVGAFGFDLIGACLGKVVDHQGVNFILIGTFEDLLEQIGMIIHVYALMLIISEVNWNRVTITGKRNFIG